MEGTDAPVLQGIRVLDFGRYIAGPYCAALLGDLGADVIRIERPGGGEDRGMTPVGGDAGTMYLAANRNKRAITLNPKSPGGREALRKLLETCDVVVANLPNASMAALGLDFPTLREINPRIILTSISAFGGRGRLSERPGFDGLGQAMSGAVYLSGEPGQPTRAAVSWVDFSTAAMASAGTLAALYRRERTGVGEHVSCSLTHTALAFNGPALIEQQVLRNDRRATLNRAPQAAPSDIFPALDGWVILYAVGDGMFRRWARMLGEEDVWLNDERFLDDAGRGAHGEIISERMSRWTSVRTVKEILRLAGEHHLPVAPVYSPADALADEDLREACAVRELDYPGVGASIPLVTRPITLASDADAGTVRPPGLGEHTAEILGELGYDGARLEEMRRKGDI